MVNHYEAQVIFQDIEHQLLQNILYYFFIIAFYEIFIKLRSIFDPFKFNIGSFNDIDQPCKVFTSQYLRYDDSLFLS